ncbi:hypothetical protein [uncultured Paraglaciecola sp.]|uniref:hypothetical protein n=1 Tax=uncultured Paraglaciecola sp. TaxID=1765024 RepID=UPI00262D3FBE|nr:hypothetical protein [uncultured Paraglaciecola sp.]
MKKVLGIFVLVILLIASGIYYIFSGAGDFIAAQIEKQGSQYLATPVSVSAVELSLAEGRMSIIDLHIKNPQGFNDKDALSVDNITLDLGKIINQPYVVQTVSINAPEVLYEVNQSGEGNLLELKNNLIAKLSESKSEPQTSEQAAANPLVIVEKVEISKVRLKLDFEQLPTGDLKLDTKSYEITLPTFSAGSIGQPNGMPANQVGLEVVKAMLDNVIKAAKAEAKKRLAEQAKQKVQDKLKDKVKGLLNKD